MSTLRYANFIVNAQKFLYTDYGDRMKIQEIIIVEGKHDSAVLKQYFDVDTIETNGSAINEETLAFISSMHETRGVIVFTDPDYPGTRIRNMINARIQGCKHAFLPKEKALGNHKVGIEHASRDDLWDALQHVVTFQPDFQSDITMDVLVELGLNGLPNSAEKRKQLCAKLHIAPCNAKTLCKRLQMMGIKKLQLQNLMEV